MIEYIDYPLSRHFLAKLIDEEKRERIKIVSQIINSIRLKEKGTYEYGNYLWTIEDEEIKPLLQEVKKKQLKKLKKVVNVVC